MPDDASEVSMVREYSYRMFKPMIEALGHVCSGFSKVYVGYATRMLTHYQR